MDSFFLVEIGEDVQGFALDGGIQSPQSNGYLFLLLFEYNPFITIQQAQSLQSHHQIDYLRILDLGDDLSDCFFPQIFVVNITLTAVEDQLSTHFPRYLTIFQKDGLKYPKKEGLHVLNTLLMFFLRFQYFLELLFFMLRIVPQSKITHTDSQIKQGRNVSPLQFHIFLSNLLIDEQGISLVPHAQLFIRQQNIRQSLAIEGIDMFSNHIFYEIFQQFLLGKSQIGHRCQDSTDVTHGDDQNLVLQLFHVYVDFIALDYDGNLVILLVGFKDVNHAVVDDIDLLYLFETNPRKTPQQQSQLLKVQLTLTNPLHQVPNNPIRQICRIINLNQSSQHRQKLAIVIDVDIRLNVRQKTEPSMIRILEFSL